MKADRESQNPFLLPQAVVSAASRSNPGVPPGSLFSFLRAKPSVAAAALTDFDSAYSNRFYGSRFDNGSNADVGSVSAAAAVAARALHALAAGPHAAPLQVLLGNVVYYAGRTGCLDVLQNACMCVMRKLASLPSFEGHATVHTPKQGMRFSCSVACLRRWVADWLRELIKANTLTHHAKHLQHLTMLHPSR